MMSGMHSSPFLLIGKIKYHIEQYHKIDLELVHRFLCSIYVDDIAFGASSIQEAFELY